MKQNILRLLSVLTVTLLPAAAAALPESPVMSVFAAEAAALVPLPEVNAVAGNSYSATDDPAGIAVTVRGNVVKVQNAQGETLEVYDVTGKQVLAVRIDSNDKTIQLNLRKGCYILRVAKQTRKISVA